MSITKKVRLLGALLVFVGACGTGDAGGSLSSTSDAPVDTSVPSASTDSTVSRLASGPSALEDRNNDAFPDPLIDPSLVISGGPPPDGIPPIDDPAFVSVSQAGDYLTDDEPVVYVDIGGDVHGYPVQILIWHEIVNDTVGGVPVAVTYCPLCNSAVAFERIIDGQETTFGTSGLLFNSALVMYDRATETLWTHYDGRAVIGALTGTVLDPIAAPLIGWADFKREFPDAQILDREQTGFSRQYGVNPYSGYDNPDGTPFLFRGKADERAELMQRVVGVTVGEASKAWALDGLQEGTASATSGEIGGESVVIFWKTGQSTALESVEVDGGRDVGSVGVFVPEVDGTPLTFSGGPDDQFVDSQTGSVWSITGRAVSGDLEGTQLEAVPHLDTFWFAWSSYRPGTEFVAS